MKNVITLIAILLMAASSWSQEIVYDASEDYGSVKAEAGTFQILTKQPKSQEVFMDHLLYFIEDKREASSDVTLKIGQNTYVKIISQTEIDEESFVPLSDDVIYIEDVNVDGTNLNDTKK